MSRSIPARENGFMQLMEQYPDILVVRIEAAETGDFGKQTEILLARDRSAIIIGATGLDSGAVIGMSQAIGLSGRTDITVAGVEYDQKP